MTGLFCLLGFRFRGKDEERQTIGWISVYSCWDKRAWSNRDLPGSAGYGRWASLYLKKRAIRCHVHFEIIGKIEDIETSTPVTEPKFAMCVRNEECEALELRKVYRILPDKRAERDGYVRVVDESGEDYLYPESYFAPVRLSQTAQRIVAAVAYLRAVSVSSIQAGVRP